MKPAHRRAHAWIWTVLAIALPLALLTLLAIKQTVPNERPALLISAPSEASQ